MRFLGNILWFVFGGWYLALTWLFGAAIFAITIIGLIPLLYWYCSKSSDEGNRFGSNPLLSDNIV